MIQRIQTVFLLIAAILLSFLVFFPIAEMVGEFDTIVYEIGFKGFIVQKTGERAAFSTLPLSILISLCLLVTVVSIFLFKRRILQIRLSTFNVILLVGLQGLMFYYIKMAQKAITADFSFTLFFVFPTVSAILVFLALRAIARDEALVRSLDRLR
ncbi:MAG TPA: DUF4293 domain-containing protein [Tenuifilaceae bacterium]|nr:DUF4293 domain-containing protein [Tenuifilaceae bacterium]HPE18709.1 DUF4293 domain-containing protein [Tenuifilaceae bacterium]HPJ45698.1 DUF4293 domain-containing protein [Tenuifilaceae bacterium]HPQ34938.1 DUF4293 domain-containing protein [Tenuifilaceae bacterium]HRX68283.1 DUF4293 domain-containing protein [Tenuifilaceae bacterium]